MINSCVQKNIINRENLKKIDLRKKYIVDFDLLMIHLYYLIFFTPSQFEDI